MQERLIEFWLDSVNERAYQPAFLQMLSGEGYKIVHSTRHMAIEFGKDVISVGSDGIPCAFQLKGNPGSRLTLTQFRDIKPQIDELVEQRIVYPGIPDIPHRCYLVTNGEIEEEVQRAVDDLNVGYEKRGFHENTRLHLISRGTLLDWAKKHGGTFWVVDDFSVEEKLIKFYNEDGNSPPRLDLLSEGLDAILKITGDTQFSKTELVRRQVSAALFVSFALRNYAQSANYMAIAGALAALFVTLIASHERHDVPISEETAASRIATRESFIAALADFAVELGNDIEKFEAARPDRESRDYNEVFLVGDLFPDHFLWRVRALKTVALLSVLNIELTQFSTNRAIPEKALLAIKSLTRPGLTKFPIWGEAAIPQILAHIWNWRTQTATQHPDIAQYEVLTALLSRLVSDRDGYVASPYHGAEEAIRALIAKSVGIREGEAKRESQSRTSYFAEALFHCFVRSNLKTHAKMAWPSLTKIIHKSFAPDNIWDFCLWRCEHGVNRDKILKPRQEWTEVQREAADVATPHVPPQLRDDPVMLLSFIIFFPHRAMPEVVRFLHFVICKTWFLPTPKPLS